MFKQNFLFVMMTLFLMTACEDKSGASDMDTEDSGGTSPGDSDSGSDSVSDSDSDSEDGLPVELSTGTLEDARDGQEYGWVQLGETQWMTENLNFAANDSYCYDDDTSNCALYGRLYTWHGARSDESDDTVEVNVQGICPVGWRLPTSVEWRTMISAVEQLSSSGVAMKSATGWNDGGNGTDILGFAVLPSGRRVVSGDYIAAGSESWIWAATETSDIFANIASFTADSGDVTTTATSKDVANPLRCVR